MSSRRNWTESSIGEITWPLDELNDGIHALVAACGREHSASSVSLAATVTGSDLDQRIEGVAAAHGVESERLFAALQELPSLLTGSGPLVLHLPEVTEGAGDESLLLVVCGDKRYLTVVDRRQRLRRVRTAGIVSAIRRPFEDTARPRAQRAIASLGLPASVLEPLMDDHLEDVRFRGCWMLRLPAGAPLAASLRESQAPRHVLLFVIAYLLQYALFVSSWWLLGSGLLYGTIERPWIVSWALLLITLIAFRVAATWQQGRAATTLGAWLRRRLLRGALNIDRQFIRRKGVGQLFAFVVESAAVESLALSGGLASVCAGIELLAAGCIMWAALGRLLPAILFGWIVVVTTVAWVYVARRGRWTRQRVELSERLLEAMVGHRTRLVQRHPADRKIEDLALDRYLRDGQSMDAAGLLLMSVIPRAWMVLALAGLTPIVASEPSASQLAAGLGGIVLAFRGLQRLAAGVASFTGAAIAARRVASLAHAAEHTEPIGIATTTALGDTRSRESSDTTLVQVRDVTFRYQPHADPILRGTSLTLERGARVLLEGSSGSGKTTLGAIIAGLTRPDSGVVLVDGLDRASAGAAGWRKRVVMAPQPHDNYLIGGTLAFNLLMGRQWPPERADLIEAETICRELGLGDLLDRLPAGLHQIVGETGWQLSQGERTRIFLARALLQQPDLLVLDESFGGLDWENADKAMRCVHERASCVLAIAHP